MDSDRPAPNEEIGTILGVQGGLVIVRLPDGQELRCRSVARLHRPLGWMTVPVGHRARVRYAPKRSPLITEVLREDRPG